MIGLKTNVPAAAQELADVARLFYPMETVGQGMEDPCLAHEMDGRSLQAGSTGRDGCEAVCSVKPGPYASLPAGKGSDRGTAPYPEGGEAGRLSGDATLENRWLPWGALTGIPPTKLFRQLIQETGSEEAAAGRLPIPSR